MKRIALSLLLLAATLSVAAQEKITDRLQRPVPGKGTVIIHQDAALYRLLGNISSPSLTGTRIQARGYRVQVYFGSNQRADQTQAQRIGTRVMGMFPELRAYTSFISPHWICRVGDFTTHEDASAYMHKIKARGISEAMVVKSEIYVTADQLK